jgi:hypothetical protein
LLTAQPATNKETSRTNLDIPVHILVKLTSSQEFSRS